MTKKQHPNLDQTGTVEISIKPAVFVRMASALHCQQVDDEIPTSSQMRKRNVNVRKITEAAVLIAANSGQIIEQPSAIPNGPLWQLQTFSTRRTQSWLATLHDDRISDERFETTKPQPSPYGRSEKEAVLAEIFVSEILTRLWTAVLLAADQHRGTNHAGPIARSVLSNHLIARHAALQAVACDPLLTEQQRENADRIRRRSELWSDLLVGPLVCRYQLTEVTHQEQRARNFGEDRLSQGVTDPRSAIWSLTRAGLRTAFSSNHSLPPSRCAHFHRGLMRSIFSTFAAMDVAQRQARILPRAERRQPPG